MEFVSENNLLGGDTSYQTHFIGAESDGLPPTSVSPKLSQSSSNDGKDERVVSGWQRNYSNGEESSRAVVTSKQSMKVASSSSSPKKLERIRERKVSFAEDTVIKETDTIASSVPSHNYVKSVGHTQYHIQVCLTSNHLNAFVISNYVA